MATGGSIKLDLRANAENIAGDLEGIRDSIQPMVDALNEALKRLKESEEAAAALRKQLKGMDEASKAFALKQKEIAGARDEMEKLVEALDDDSFVENFQELNDSLEEARKSLVQLEKESRDLQIAAGTADDVARITDELVDLETAMRVTKAEAEGLDKEIRRSFEGVAPMAEKVAVSTRGAGQALFAMTNTMRSFGRVAKTVLSGTVRLMYAMYRGARRAFSGVAGLLGVFRSLHPTMRATNRQGRGFIRWLAGSQFSIRRFLTVAFVFNAVRRAMFEMAQTMGGLIRANDNLMASMNIVRVNMWTTFAPIWEAITPAIEAFARALAIASHRLAQFVALMSGTTWRAARDAGQALREQAQAMRDLARAARAARREIYSFDEVNQKAQDTGMDGLEIDIDWDIEEMEIPQWLIDLTDWLSNAWDTFTTDMGRILDVVRPIWDEMGEDLVNALRRAISEGLGAIGDVWGAFVNSWERYGAYVMRELFGLITEAALLVGDIFRDFRRAWYTYGEPAMDAFLNLLASMLGVVRDIVAAIRAAWNYNDMGYTIMKSLVQAFTNVLNLGREILDSFREVWNENERGKGIMTTILSIFDDILATIGNIAGGLAEAWRESEMGRAIWDTILGIFERILYRVQGVTARLREWSEVADFTRILEVINDLLYTKGGLIDTIVDGFFRILARVIQLLTENDRLARILKGVMTIVDNIVEAFVSWFEESRFIEWLLDRLVDLVEWLAEGDRAVRLLRAAFIALIAVKVLKFLTGIYLKLMLLAPAFLKTKAAVGLLAGKAGLGKLVGGSKVAMGVKGGAAGVGAKGLKGLLAFLGPKGWIAIGVITLGTVIARNWDTIVDGVTEFATNTVNRFKGWVDESDNIFAGWARATRDTWSDAWAEAYDETDGFFSRVGVATAIFTRNIGENLYENTREWAGNWRDRFVEMRDTAAETWTTMENRLKESDSYMGRIVGTLMYGIRTTVRDRGKEMLDNWQERWGDMRETISSRVESFRESAGNVMEAIRGSFVGRAVDRMIEAGRGVMNGLRDGMEGVRNSVVNTANNVGSSVLSSLENRFGISSPATTTRLLGKYLMDGLAVGIRRYKRVVDKEMDDVIDTLEQTVKITLDYSAFEDGIMKMLRLIERLGNNMQRAFQHTLGSLPFFASGTNYAPGGLAVLGEKGPEVVEHGGKSAIVDAGIYDVPRGAKVIPNHKIAEHISYPLGTAASAALSARGNTRTELSNSSIGRIVGGIGQTFAMTMGDTLAQSRGMGQQEGGDFVVKIDSYEVARSPLTEALVDAIKQGGFEFA